MDTAARGYIHNDRSWASGKTLDKRVNTRPLRALRDVAGEVPEALLPEEHHVHVRKNVIGGDATVNAKIKMTTDLKVLQFVRSGDWKPDTDGFWDGVMYLEITDVNNRIRRRRAREWWESGGVYYVSIDRPWFDTGTNEMDFRIYQPSFYLPANTIEVLTPLRLFDDSEQLVGRSAAAPCRKYRRISGAVSGRPTDFWRGEFQQLPSPTEAPKVSSVLKNADAVKYHEWLGPVQEGKFEFCYTYAWGRKEAEWGESMGGFEDPQFESAPSPISTVYDHASESERDGVAPRASHRHRAPQPGGDAGLRQPQGDSAERLHLPAALPGSAELCHGRSGIKIRIYVRRLRPPKPTALKPRTPPPLVQSDHRLIRVEADEKFYLLMELDPLVQNKRYDSGLATRSTRPAPGRARPARRTAYPDPTRQLRETTATTPTTCGRSPTRTTTSTCAPASRSWSTTTTSSIKQEAFSAYMELALAYMSRLDGVDQNSEVKHRALYRQLVRRFRSQHGDNNCIVENKAWGEIRPRYRYGTFQEG